MHSIVSNKPVERRQQLEGIAVLRRRSSAHNRELSIIDFDLGASELADQHGVAHLHFKSMQGAVVRFRARA